MPIRRGFVALSTGQAHYRAAGTGAPVILLHQSPSSSAMFAPLLPLLATERLAIAIDTPGYGESSLPRYPTSIAQYADAIVEAIRALGFATAPVHGYHTGAAIAIEAAARRPDVISAVSLGGVPLFDEAERAARLASLANPPFLPDPIQPDGGHLLAIFRRMTRVAKDPQEATALTIERVELGQHGHWGFEAAFQYDLAARLPHVRQPIQIIIGVADGIYANTQAARALIGPHDYVELEGGSRFEDIAADSATAILRFLRDHHV
ncbi:MAG: alpha/beta hydrolase [Dehalococcoidia bacterium]|nr:alpha/beta hydrolase [Dehalococcoidia bacterium]